MPRRSQLLAKGGSLRPEEVLQLYRGGYFLMADDDGKVGVYSANPRAILPFERFHVSRRMRRELKASDFEIVFDRDCEGVIRGCSERERTWISEEIIQVYLELHRRGFVHSVEAWQEGRLVGGLYGVALGSAFCGESMFHRVSNASKACLVALVSHLRERNYTLLDCQAATSHTERFGVELISEEKYQLLLKEALGRECSFGIEKES